MHSCRNILLNIKDLRDGENASLLMSRYVRNLDENKEDARMKLFDAMESAAENAKELYTQAFANRHNALKKIALSRNFETIEPLAAGLGNTSVIETGISLNPTFGLPMIPGSSVKGITAHYYAENFGQDKIYNAIFGSDSQDDEQQGGFLRFYDAWLLPECANSAFIDDVMTPHNMKYYSGDIKKPSDFEDPNPVRFLAVNGKFEFLIGAENFELNKNEVDKKWIDFAFDILESALKNFGIGGKLHAGYGKMKSILSQEQIEAKNLEAKRAQNLKDGFTYSEGEILDVVCSKIKIFKGKEKRTFNFVEGDDKIPVNFEAIPKVDEGTVIKAKILRLQKGSNKAYILQAL